MNERNERGGTPSQDVDDLIFLGQTDVRISQR